jgi:hypothetical protein
MNQLLNEVLAEIMTADGWAEYGSMIEPNMLPDTTVRAVYELIARLHTNNPGRTLIPEDLAIMIAATYSDPDRAKEIYNVIPKAPPTSSPATRGQAIRDYVSRQHIARAITYGATHLHAPDLDPAVVLDHAAHAVEVRGGRGEDIARYSESPLPGTFDDRPGLMGLGLSAELDRALGGGIAAGELGILLAGPSRGKTSLICTTGAHSAVTGTRPLHITLEISKSKVWGRYDVALTHCTMPELRANPTEAAEIRTRLRDRGSEPLVVDWSYTRTCPSDVRNAVMRARSRGEPPGIVLVDYLELMVPNTTKGLSRREQRHVFGQLGIDMRMLAVELQLPILTAWQVNREGSGLDMIGAEHVSECWDIVKHADIIISINQNPSEERAKSARLGILKQRDNTERNRVGFPVMYDMDRCIVQDMDMRIGRVTTHDTTKMGTAVPVALPEAAPAGARETLDNGQTPAN